MSTDPAKLELQDLVRTVERRCHGDALERLTEAVRLSESLQRLSDDLVGHFVEAARESGSSWAEIGSHLGVTKQAAQQRHVARRGFLRRIGGGETPFARFAPAARQAVTHAQTEARQLDHDFLGTEHLLLGLLHERHGIAAIVLGEMGLDLASGRDAVIAVVGRGSEARGGPLRFAPRAKRVLELALREAKHLGHERVDTEHFLLGMLREGQGVGARILADRGITADRVRTRVLELRTERH
jgi:ClpA/ClpB-like protein